MELQWVLPWAQLELVPVFVFMTKSSLEFKVEPSTSKKSCFISFSASPLKLMKNPFYFILKVFFCLDFLVM